MAADTDRMTLPELEERLDRYGPDITVWPDAEKAAAQSLMDRSEYARRLMAEARALDRLLKRPAPPAPAGLVDRIVAKALEESPAPSHGEDCEPWYAGAGASGTTTADGETGTDDGKTGSSAHPTLSLDRSTDTDTLLRRLLNRLLTRCTRILAPFAIALMMAMTEFLPVGADVANAHPLAGSGPDIPAMPVLTVLS